MNTERELDEMRECVLDYLGVDDSYLKPLTECHQQLRDCYTRLTDGLYVWVVSYYDGKFSCNNQYAL